MSHTLDSLQNTMIASTFTVPDDGDAQGVASINGAFLQLTNAARAFALHAYTGLRSEGWMRCDPGGSNVTPRVFIGGVYSVVVQGEVCTFPEYEVLLSDVSGSPVALSNSTWYYVSLDLPNPLLAPGVVGRVARLVVSTTPPASRVLADGSESRYIGCFVTDSAGAPVPFYMVDGEYTYLGSANCPLASSGHATATTDIVLTPAVPPHAKVIRASCVIAAGASGYSAEFYSGSVLCEVVPQLTDGDHARQVIFYRRAATALRYKVSNVAATAVFYVYGFKE